MKYAVLAYYHFFAIASPVEEAERHKVFLRSLAAKGRIYFSPEGVNAQFALPKEHVATYREYLDKDPRYLGVDIKQQEYDEAPFAKLTVKARAQLVAINRPVDLQNRAKYLSSEEWVEMLEKRDENTVVLDVRNNYESNIGHFQGAITPDIATFREFVDWIDDLKKHFHPHKTRVMTYCTGGIRCEIFSPLIKEAGFEEVYQLHGGVIRYAEEQGDKYWQGKLFVFDDRLTIPLDPHRLENTISHCLFCSGPTDVYYNCANMDCNELFIACRHCIAENKGCCSSTCLETGRVRHFDPKKRQKPFRKLSQEEKQIHS